MIKWNYLGVSIPKGGLEFIAKNDAKVINEGSSAKRCKVMKFHHAFTARQIKAQLLNDGFTVWAYTD